jgi:hypothetical protein
MKSKIETFKSIILIVLVISTAMLTQLNLFDGLIISQGQSNTVDLPSSKLSFYINPQSYFVGLGGLSYTKVYDPTLQDNIWSEIRPFILSTLLNHDEVMEISKDDYVRAFSENSLMVRMPFEMPIEDFYSLFSSEVLSNDVKSIYPKEYLMREGNVRSLFLFDERNQKYYLIKHKTLTHDIGSVISRIKDSDYIEYRKISDRFSLTSTVSTSYNQKNYELIPYLYDFMFPTISIENEVRLQEAYFTNDVSGITSAVFGNRLDFVKRLKDVNDSVVLMYGYGDKSITVSHDGKISYRKKLEADINNRMTFKDAFALAMGKVENFGAQPDGLYLTDYEYVAQENTYRFYLNYKIAALSMGQTKTNDHPYFIEVRDHQVISVDKNVKFNRGEVSLDAFSSVERMFTIDDCLANNFLEVSIYYLQDNNIYTTAQDTIEYYFPVRSEISSIELNYIEGFVSDNAYLLPTWQVVISGRTYLFNAYDGELIKTYR